MLSNTLIKSPTVLDAFLKPGNSVIGCKPSVRTDAVCC